MHAHSVNRTPRGNVAVHGGVPRLVALLMAVLVLLAVPASATAHGNGQLPLHSVVTAVEPRRLPIEATTREQDYERLYLRNKGAEDLVVFDYQGEPYARVTPDEVLLNSRLGMASAPKWMVYESEPAFAYHDHRAHWMGSSLPRRVDPSRDEVQEAYRWSVPIRYGGKPGAIKGVVYYVPPSKPGAFRSQTDAVAPSRSKPLVWPLALVAVLSIAAAVVAARKARPRRPR